MARAATASPDPKPRRPGPPPAAGDLEAILARIPTMSRAEIVAEWAKWLSGEPPIHLGKMFNRHLLAWKLQERVHGGLSAATRRKLKELQEKFAKDPDYHPASKPALAPGTVLVRVWQGVEHRVEVMTEGYRYKGETFASLTLVAKKITGAHWSGPLFFGLKKKRKDKSP